MSTEGSWTAEDKYQAIESQMWNQRASLFAYKEALISYSKRGRKVQAQDLIE